VFFRLRFGLGRIPRGWRGFRRTAVQKAQNWQDAGLQMRSRRGVTLRHFVQARDDFRLVGAIAPLPRPQADSLTSPVSPGR
jgi:hypothetical protein